jgi:GYF domain 2
VLWNDGVKAVSVRIIGTHQPPLASVGKTGQPAVPAKVVFLPPMPSAAEDPTDWYVARERKPSGPYSRGFIRDAARGGALSRQDLVWRPGWVEWREAGAVDGLVDVTTSETETPGPETPGIAAL